MKKGKQDKYLLRLRIILLFILIIEGIIGASIVFYYFYKIPTVQSIHNISIDTSTLVEQELPPTEETLAALDTLPSDYEKISSVLGKFTSTQLTTYLLHSQVVIDSDQKNITEAYTLLKTKNISMIIPQEYLDIYFINKIQEIATNILTKDSSLSKYLKTDRASSVEFSITKCIEENQDTFIQDPYISPCKDILERIDSVKELPTLNTLINWIKYSKDTKIGDEYDKYLHNILYTYQLEKSPDSKTSDTQTTPLTIDPSTYLEIDSKDISKLQYILDYIKTVYEQAGIRDDKIKNEITDLQSELEDIKEYEDGKVLDISPITTNLDIPNEKVSWLVKSLKFAEETKTLVMPIYKISKYSTLPALTFEINNNNFNEPYDVTPLAQSKGSTRIPIFMYHQIVNPPAGASSFVAGLYISPTDFEEQLAYLVKHNYKTITPLELYNQLKAGGNPFQKSVMITFDDGVSNHYTTAYPLLKKYGLVGVFYIKSKTSALNGTQMKEMANNGMIIDSHSATHPDLKAVNDPTRLTEEIVSSRYAIGATTGQTVYSIAYPGCVADKETYQYVTSAGYLIGVSCGRAIDHYFANRLSLSRVHAFGDMNSFKNLLSGK